MRTPKRTSMLNFHLTTPLSHSLLDMSPFYFSIGHLIIVVTSSICWMWSK